MKKTDGPFLSRIIGYDRAPGNNLEVYTRFFDKYFSNDTMIFLGPKMSINKFFKQTPASRLKRVSYFFLVVPSLADLK